MGDVGNFLFGGSKSNQSGQNSYQSVQQSTNSAQNSSAQAAASRANNFQKSGSAGYNQAYAPMSAAMTPALGYVTQAGDMMGALLGLQPNTFSYKPTTYTPGPLMPSGGSEGNVSTPKLDDLIKSIAGTLPKPNAPPPAPAIPTTPITLPSGGSSGNTSGGTGSGNLWQSIFAGMDRREFGGPVRAGRPYIVGERRPEVFVPEQDGTILPSVPDGMMHTMGRITMDDLRGGPRGRQPRQRPPRPGASPVTPTPTPTPTPAPANPVTTVSTQVNPNVNPTSAINTFANNAGMDFILDQGQKAISGASAANGVFNSGATGKALVQYGQNLGRTYLGDYMDRLMQYGQLGLGAGSALANAGGVNQSQSLGGGSSSSTSAGVSQGSSVGQSTGVSSGSGTTSGKSSSKKGLF